MPFEPSFLLGDKQTDHSDWWWQQVWSKAAHACPCLPQTDHEGWSRILSSYLTWTRPQSLYWSKYSRLEQSDYPLSKWIPPELLGRERFCTESICHSDWNGHLYTEHLHVSDVIWCCDWNAKVGLAARLSTHSWCPFAESLPKGYTWESKGSLDTWINWV